MHKSGKRGGRGKKSFGGDQGPRTKKGYLQEQTLNHYRRISDSLNEPRNDEDKEIFLNNAFSCLAEEIVLVSQNQTVSTIIESLIAVGSPSNLRTLFVAAVADLSVAFLDRFASHVFETLVQNLPHFYDQPPQDSTDSEDDRVPQEKFVESFKTMCQFVEENFETLITHMYGSHVFRALLEGLSGVPVAHELKKSQRSKQSTHPVKEIPTQPLTQKLPDQFRVLFDKYAERIFRFCDYEVHLKDPFFSLMLQAVLLIWRKVDTGQCLAHCQDIIKRVVQSCSHSDSESDDPAQCVPDVAQDAVGSHLLEVIFKLGSAELTQQVYDQLLQGKLLYYAIHPVANYVLQSFIANLKDSELMEKVFDELSKNLEDVLAVGYMGLVTSLAEACRRLRLKQEEFILNLMESFHCNEPKERQLSLVKLLASLTTYDVFFSLEEGSDKPTEGTEEPALKGPVNIHGSLLLQQLLQFQKPKHAALGLVDLKAEELKELCCDPSGSHVVDVFFSSATVLDRNKDNFLKKLKGWLVEVACTKNGSRCLESVWKNLNVKQRTRLAEELAESDRLRNDRFGHFLFRNFGLGLFSHKRPSWLEMQGAQTKRRRQMRELLHSLEPPAKKKKDDDQDLELQQQDKDEELEDDITAMFIKQKKVKPSKHQKTTPPQDTNEGGSDSEDLSPLPAGPSQLAEDGEGVRLKKKKRKRDKQESTTVASELSAEFAGEDCDSGEDNPISDNVMSQHRKEKSPRARKDKEKKKSRKMKLEKNK